MIHAGVPARKAGLAVMTAVLAATLASATPASAFYRRGYRHHGGLGVGAAVGLGIGAAALGAVAAGVAARNSYNGYPVYPGPVHPGYGYDYYPKYGYYGPY